ncbi:hypothetical protein [Streptomyces sp. NPDC048277]|uniref:hypothetical protein n=1 Tax=Streptomyces sp. NPDC048277 TaxID=3155027 RepID=UPI00340EBAA6
MSFSPGGPADTTYTSYGEQAPQQPKSPTNSPLMIRLVYIAMGLILGGVWIASSGESLISHIWHDLAILIVMLVVVRSRLGKRAARPGATPMPEVSYSWIIGAKLGLLVVAAGVQWILQQAGNAHPDIIVAVGLFAVLAVAGPAAHHLFIRAPKHV